VWKWFDRDFAVVPRDLVIPKGQTDDEAAQEAGAEMEESQDHAITASLCALGTPVTARIVIEGLLDNGPAAKAGILKGDVLTGVDRKPVDSVCTLRRLTRLRKPGDVVAVTVRRDGAERTFDVHTNTTDVGNDGRPLFGVELGQHDQKQPFPVQIFVPDVGGPSAGLMFALGIYDRLTVGDLTGGKIIAGTGTIDDEGAVGSIGGIQQKLAAARNHKAEWFLCPAGNYEEALTAKPDGLKLVKVATLDEALAALREIAAGRTP
jgi:PDZ domain-containing protein